MIKQIKLGALITSKVKLILAKFIASSYVSQQYTNCPDTLN